MNWLWMVIWLLPIPCLAQQLALEGRVSIHNSRYETGTIQYVSAVHVAADSAVPTMTDVNGHFQLVFVGMDFGQSTPLQVEKKDMEVVNAHELMDVVVGRSPPLRIALAPQGQIAKARLEFYQVNLAALTVRYDTLIARLRGDSAASAQVIQNLETQINRTIQDRYEAEEILNQQLAETRRRLPEFAHELARVNLDFASEMYQQAYELLKAGKVEEAISVLDESKLDPVKDSIMAALDSIAHSQVALEQATAYELKRLDTLIASMRLRAQAFEMKGEYALAIQELRETIPLLGQKESQPLLLAQTENHMATLFHLTQQFDSVYARQAHAYALLESICGFEDTRLEDLRLQLVEFTKQRVEQLYQQGDCKTALNWLERAMGYVRPDHLDPTLAKTMRRLRRCVAKQK